MELKMSSSFLFLFLFLYAPGRKSNCQGVLQECLYISATTVEFAKSVVARK